MADTAAHLVDRVIPAVPVRQWVFSMPYALRHRVAFDSALLTNVLGIMIGAEFEFLKRSAHDSGIPKSKCVAVAFVQRFGSAANLNPHGHFLVLDGVYAAYGAERPVFYPVRPWFGRRKALLRQAVSRKLNVLEIRYTATSTVLPVIRTSGFQDR